MRGSRRRRGGRRWRLLLGHGRGRRGGETVLKKLCRAASWRGFGFTQREKRDIRERKKEEVQYTYVIVQTLRLHLRLGVVNAHGLGRMNCRDADRAGQEVNRAGSLVHRYRWFHWMRREIDDAGRLTPG